MAEGRSGDLVLSQGTYAFVQDGANGGVDVITGPSKVSLADTDKPVIYEKDTRRFTPTSSDRAVTVSPVADEGQYLVLTNPTTDEGGLRHPPKGKQGAIELKMGKKINIPGPAVFALYPGQVAEVVDGHQLKSNEYLLIRVYNEKEAKENLKNSVIKTAEGTESSKKGLFDEKEIRTGNLLIIKGTDVSFYMPPTGIEVVIDSDTDKYTRNAVTLERLEYCILLDQNGDKRYVKGPDVVFPKPTEVFIENESKKIYRAVELNDNMGIYIKVIADYVENDKKYLAGEELFITGKEQKIYFPRPEHAIVKYGKHIIHYAVAVPAGEGRYILNKNNGNVKLTKGNVMLLPDPRNEVIVKRALSDKTVELWYPNNAEALKYNQQLRSKKGDSEFIEDYGDSLSNGRAFTSKQTMYCSSVGLADAMERKSEFTQPRTIQLDTKYEGAVLMNIWPNYAVQIVNKTGERKVVEGPKIIMLEYDETLEVLELSTGKPKTDHNRMKTVYLQTKNNVVSDVITIETKDLIPVNIRLSYKVDFESDPKKWFNVSDYVKLLTQHMRSLIRNAAKKYSVEDFNESASDIIRDTILGESKDGKRNGRVFSENGMKIYDVEILEVSIDDEEIAEMLIENQHNTVEQNLKFIKIQKDFTFTKKTEEITRSKLDEQLKTSNKQTEVELSKVKNLQQIAKTKVDNDAALKNAQTTAEKELQKLINEIAAAKLAREKADTQLAISNEKERAEMSSEAFTTMMDAIQPGLIEAILTSTNIEFTRALAENLKEQRSGLFGESGGFEGMLTTLKGSGLDEKIKDFMETIKTFKAKTSKTPKSKEE